ncbi:MAG: ribonuclease D [Alphaproteobacteria bacterium]|nr:ribonuclease D [Alphaproteobacteria bacterium]
MLITTTKELSRFCKSLAGAAFVTVDTEFMRERTYWSRLCLVQLAGPEAAVAVDPLADGIDLAPLYALMADPKILKVFHAARQDVEIFFNATGQVPAPMFDTQVAAMVCGFGEAASYETLAAKLAKAKIDKSSRFTDWCRRPLTERQITYALGDVTHLREVYARLNEQLEKSGRSEWMREEMAVLTNPATYQIDPQEVWKRLRLRSDKPQLRAMVRELAAWRELEAQRLNIPRGRVIKDETLMEIAHHAPATAADLAHTRGLSQGLAEGRQGAEILAAIARAKALPPERDEQEAARQKKPKVSAAVYDLLKVLLKQVSDEQGVAAKLIATSDDLERLAAEDEPDIPVLSGWRRKLFGDMALALKRGEMALAVQGKKVVVLKK